MTINELKIATYLYSKFTDYDRSFSEIMGKHFDLNLELDQDTILNFLRAWGCRQFKKDDQAHTAKEISNWFKGYSPFLEKINWNLFNATDNEISNCEIMFNDLMNLTASIKKNFKHTIGPVGAAKLLFALKNNSFAPWDGPIIKNRRVSKDGYGYCLYLFFLKENLLSIKSECESKGIDFNNLPSILNKPKSSHIKIIDEYLWVSITRGCKPTELLKFIKS